MSGEQLEPGTLLNDRYRIIRVIGIGGMGTVYQAEHVRLDTILAVKEVRAPKSAENDTEELLRQCEHEARFLVRLHHPNLPQVTDAFLEDGRFFVVMEYIEGINLEARAREAAGHGIPAATVVDWALQIADVLAYLHSQDPPIIFRDLKPANVMVESTGRIRLIDFGIARRFQPGAVKDTTLLGSVGYSPPEQFGRHQTDTRSDIYSFGATLHNLLTGRDPSQAPFKFTPARTINPTVPEPLSRLVDCCLRLDADARPQSIHEVAMDLLTIRDSLPDAAEAAPAEPADPVAAPSAPSGGANIILTNSTLRNTGKSGRGSQRVGSGTVGSGRIGAAAAKAPSGSTAGSTAGSASGAVKEAAAAADPARGRAGIWIAGGVTVLAACGISIFMLTVGAKPHAGRPGGTNGPAVGGIAPTNDAGRGRVVTPPPTTPGGAGQQIPTDSGTSPTLTQNRFVTFDAPILKEVGQDPTGKLSLRIAISGAADGVVGDQFKIAAFFYDAQNNQIAAQTQDPAYASKDGKLAVASVVTLTSAHTPFQFDMTVPIAVFPANLTDGAQFHCVAFYGDQRIGETKAYTTVSAAALAVPGATTPGTPPSDGTAGSFGQKPADNGAGAPGTSGLRPADGSGPPPGANPPTAPPRSGGLSSQPLKDN